MRQQEELTLTRPQADRRHGEQRECRPGPATVDGDREAGQHQHEREAGVEVEVQHRAFALAHDHDGCGVARGADQQSGDAERRRHSVGRSLHEDRPGQTDGQRGRHLRGLEYRHVVAAHEGADRDAAEIDDEQQQLEQHRHLRGVEMFGCERAHRHADHGHVGRQRCQPPSSPPIDRVAEPQGREAEGDEIERERNDDSGLHEDRGARRQRADDGEPGDRAQPPAPRDVEQRRACDRQRDRAAKPGQYLEARGRLDDQREREQRTCQRVRDGIRQLAVTARAIAEEEPHRRVRERATDADRDGQRSRIGHRTEEEATGEDEEEPADERQDGDRVVRILDL
jgi:hypothetical protein